VLTFDLDAQLRLARQALANDRGRARPDDVAGRVVEMFIEVGDELVRERDETEKLRLRLLRMDARDRE